MKKILISRTDKIGDLILTTPLIREIKQNIKDCFLGVLISNYAKDILYNNPDVDLILTKEDENLVKKIKEENFEIAIIVFPEFKIAFDIFKAGIKERIGTLYRWYSLLFFNKPVKLHRKKSNLHEAELNLLLAKDLIGIKKPERVYYYPTEEERKKADEFIKKNGLDKFIIIYIGGKGSADNLSIKKYASLTRDISENIDMKILVCYGIDEIEKMKQFSGYLENKKNVFILKQPLYLRDLAAVIEKCEIFISGSTGPMHIAAALLKKTISFFPDKEGTLPTRWRPLGNKAIIIQKEKEKTMDDIDNFLVIEKIKELLK